MTRRKTAEERIKELEEARGWYIEGKVNRFEEELRAQYQAKIDVLKKFGLKPRVKTKTLEEKMDKGKERLLFYYKRYLELRWGRNPEEAKEGAERLYYNYRKGWLNKMKK